MPLASLIMIKLTRIFNSVKHSLQRNKQALFVMIILFFLISISTVGAKISVGKFEDALTSNNYNKESFDFQTTYGMVSSLNIMIGGCNSKGCTEKLGTSAIDGVGKMITYLYTSPPASGVAYAMSTLENIGIVKTTYAQTGVGYQKLQPLLPLWKEFRNLAYSLFVLIFVIMGFAIMFRMKLNPQTIITIQSALPRIVVALLLVTFSYAIVGFIVDLIYVLIALSALIFNNAIRDTSNIPFPLSEYVEAGSWRLISNLTGLIPLKELAIALALGAVSGGLAALATGPVGWSILSGAGLGAGFLLLILLGILLWIIFNLFLELLRSYIAILIALVFAPIQITLGVIPGLQHIGFGAWFKNTIAHAAVFPAVAFVLMLGYAIPMSINNTNISMWNPPFLPGSTPSLIAGIISFGLLLTIQHIPKIVKNSIGATDFNFNMLQSMKAPTNLASQPVKYYAGPELESRAERKNTNRGKIAGVLHKWGVSKRWWEKPNS